MGGERREEKGRRKRRESGGEREGKKGVGMVGLKPSQSKISGYVTELQQSVGAYTSYAAMQRCSLLYQFITQCDNAERSER